MSMSLTAPIVVTAAQPTMRCAQKSTTSLRLLVQLGVNALPSFPLSLHAVEPVEARTRLRRAKKPEES